MKSDEIFQKWDVDGTNLRNVFFPAKTLSSSLTWDLLIFFWSQKMTKAIFRREICVETLFVMCSWWLAPKNLQFFLVDFPETWLTSVSGIPRQFPQLLGGAMCPSWKMMEWKSMGRIMYPIYEMENKIHVWNHQPAIVVTSLPIYIPYDTPIMFETTNQSKHVELHVRSARAAALCPFDVSLFPHLWWPCSVLGFETRHRGTRTVPQNSCPQNYGYHWIPVNYPIEKQ